ncbi:MAG: DUF3488 domain-containing protein [Planctomycetia bacterium]|nr:DUF3488 domain-containing protein [Planctomycetia bacterium]
MSVERLLQFSMALTAFLAALMLGLSEQRMWLALVTGLAAVLSLYFGDVRGTLQLSTTWANVLGLAALGATVWEVFTVDTEYQLLALANMLVYLQWVLLFRHKEPRIYWMILLLSLLQVAVASVMSLTAIFGILMVLYVFSSLTGLVSFTVDRERRGPAPSQSRPETERIDIFSTPISVVFARLLGLRRRSAAQGKGTGRWPLGFDAPKMTARDEPSVGLRRESARGLWRVAAVLAIGAFLLAPPLFALVPRTDRSLGWYPSGLVGQSLVGFSEMVRLGELGEMAENPSQVMRVRLSDHRTGEPIKLQDELLMRGMPLVDYEGGRWNRQPSPKGETVPPPRGIPAERLVDQEIVVEPLENTDVVFAVWPVYDAERSRRVQLDRVNERLSRDKGPNDDYAYRLTYRLVTTGIHDSRQLPFRPYSRDTELPAVRRAGILQPYAAVYPQTLGEPQLTPEPRQLVRQREQLAPLASLADDVVADIPSADPQYKLRCCRALEAHFRDSGQYTYSLRPPIRDRRLDPVVDFVTRQPEGHCEYFASALALMLRSRGIPCRIVVGFKGGEWNESGSYYMVRQLNAHTWVEAYFRPSEMAALPADEIPPGNHTGGVWLQLDPTPPGTGAEATLWSTLMSWRDFGEYVWGRFVLGLTAKDQQQSIYDPLKSAVQWLGGLAPWQDAPDAKLTLAGEETASAKKMSGMIVGLVLLAAPFALAGAFWLVRWAARRLRRGATSPSAGDRTSPVAFYRRLEALLATRELHRLPGQTQREFALAAGGQLADDPRTQGASSLPRKIVDSFYRVRFGGRTLDEQEAAAVDSALVELDSSLRAAAEAADRKQETGSRR